MLSGGVSTTWPSSRSGSSGSANFAHDESTNSRSGSLSTYAPGNSMRIVSKDYSRKPWSGDELRQKLRSSVGDEWRQQRRGNLLA